MRVLHLFKSYYPPTRGGIEQWINEIVHARMFRDAGIGFVVLTAADGRALVDEMDDGVRVVRAPALVRASTAPVVPSWSSWIKRLQPDVLHVHMPNPTGELAVLGSRTRSPIVASYHADVVRRGPVPAAYDAFASRFLRRARSITVSSPRLASTTPALRGHEAKIAVVPFGVDPDEWSVRPSLADEIRERYGPGPLVVLLGRLVHYKGTEVLVEAMRDVEATALIVGDGPRRAGAEAAAVFHGVADRVVFTGAVADADRAAYLHAADVFVLPSTNRGEAYGIVQVQAMATGTPSISTEIGTGTSWVNRHDETGLVVPSGDPIALAKSINELLGDDARRAAMGDAARRRVREHLTAELMFGGLRRLYEAAAAGR
jgi:glycosyltransferase involved in cell wall biosynthesis